MKKMLQYILIFSIANQWVEAVMPPTKEQIRQYQNDGSYEVRKERAKAFKNHVMSPYLRKKIPVVGPTTKILPSGVFRPMPSSGDVNMLVLMIDFSDFPHKKTYTEMENAIKGDASSSFKSFYHTTSYGKLNIKPTILGWYRSRKSRANIVQSNKGREALLKEALQHYDDEGHDFSKYDNDNDGYIDYLAVFWTGPTNGWGNFWWGYSHHYSGVFRLDGVKFSRYTWQWESTDMSTLKHETGHALGLPDLYDYSGDRGPDGGLGGYGLMAGAWGDFNPYFKWLLDWNTPTIMSEGDKTITLKPMGLNDKDSAIVIWPGASNNKPHSEFFLVANKWRTGTDSTIHTDGLIIYHVDGSLNSVNNWKYNNSYTEHKLLRIMEADGLEEIEQGHWVDAEDYYKEGDVFNSVSSPSSHAYDGSDTKISLENIHLNSSTQSITFDAKITEALGGITSPKTGSVIGGMTTFTWDKNNASYLYMYVTDSTSNTNLYAGYVNGNTLQVNIPQNGHKIRVTLYSYISGSWKGSWYYYRASLVSQTIPDITSMFRVNDARAYAFRSDGKYSRYNIKNAQNDYSLNINGHWPSKIANVKSNITASFLAPNNLVYLFLKDGTYLRYYPSTEAVSGPFKVAGIWGGISSSNAKKIIAALPWKGSKFIYFFLSDGNYIKFNWSTNTAKVNKVTESNWPGVSTYAQEITGAIKYSESTGYIFLTNNRYLKYNYKKDKASGVRSITQYWDTILD